MAQEAHSNFRARPKSSNLFPDFTMNNLSQLPTDLMKKIQLLLPRKEAARTAILSKDWYYAWSNREVLDFDQDEFLDNGKRDRERFYKFINGTIQSFEERNTKISSLWIVPVCFKSFVDENVNWPSRRINFIERLELSLCNIRSFFFNGFSSKFPFVKVLVIRNCIEIDNPSIEEILFEHTSKLIPTFNIPRIRKFSFIGKGLKLPNLSFVGILKKFESNIWLDYGGFRLTDFHDLKKFLKNLMMYSEINIMSLILGFLRDMHEDFQPPAGDVHFPKAVLVKCLKIGVDTRKFSPAVMDALFWSLRPECICHVWKDSRPAEVSNKFLQSLGNTLMEEGRDEDLPNQNTEPADLVGVCVEEFDISSGNFKPLDRKMIFTAGMGDELRFSQRQVRFKLQWKANQ